MHSCNSIGWPWETQTMAGDFGGCCWWAQSHWFLFWAASWALLTSHITLQTCCWLPVIVQWDSSSVLTSPSSWLSLLHSISRVSSSEIRASHSSAVSQHASPFGWLQYSHEGYPGPSDILVGYCKGPNQSVPSNYVRKGKLLYLWTGSDSIPITRIYKAWWQVFGLCSGNSLVVSSLTVELVWAVISLPARIGFDLCVYSFLLVITTASKGRRIYKAEYIHNLVILQNQLKILWLDDVPS